MMGVVAVGVCTSSATTRVVSTLPACVLGGAGVLVVVAAAEPDDADRVEGCVGAVAAVVVDLALDSWGSPGVLGAGISVSGVAIGLAGAVAAVEPGSDGAEPVVELGGELVCGPPVPTATPAAPERLRPTSPAGDTEAAGPAGVEAAVEDVRVPPGLPAVTGSGGPSGFR
jgi:hypothetical protein